jgi:hypothetical protein
MPGPAVKTRQAVVKIPSRRVMIRSAPRARCRGSTPRHSVIVWRTWRDFISARASFEQACFYRCTAKETVGSERCWSCTTHPVSTCSQKVRMALFEKELPWTDKTIQFARKDHLSGWIWPRSIGTKEFRAATLSGRPTRLGPGTFIRVVSTFAVGGAHRLRPDIISSR